MTVTNTVEANCVRHSSGAHSALVSDECCVMSNAIKRNSQHPKHITHHTEGISIISLIITIIVIIILAAIVIFSGLNTPDGASFAGFTTQVDNVY